jgi:hypothetical protein
VRWRGNHWTSRVLYIAHKILEKVPLDVDIRAAKLGNNRKWGKIEIGKVYYKLNPRYYQTKAAGSF